MAKTMKPESEQEPLDRKILRSFKVLVYAVGIMAWLTTTFVNCHVDKSEKKILEAIEQLKTKP